MDTQTFFSVIIPSFNRKGLLKTAVSSVLTQSCPDFELIIIDDGSTDGTEKMVRSFKDKRIIYRYQQNRGVSTARNNGIQISKGAYISFLDSDDRWVPEKLEKTLHFIENHPAINIFHTEEVWCRGGKILNQKKKHRKPSGYVYKNSLALCCISISTATVKRSVFNYLGAFDESLEACEDYDFWLRAAKKYEVKLIPENLTIKDGGRPDQLSSSVWGLDRFRIKALEKMLLSGNLTKEEYGWTHEALGKKCSLFALGCEKRGKEKEAVYYQNLPEKYRLITGTLY